MRIHQSGGLNVKAFIENPSTVVSDAGTVTQPTTPSQEIWIGIKPVSGAERMVADQMMSIATHLVLFRRNSFITSGTELRLKSEPQRVLRLLEHPRESSSGERGGDYEALAAEQTRPVED